ncbi:MAG: hypothetical protein HFG42_06010 [Lachnospiraceae bacterium]|nr:hypothetical protein [Lachnospiraceae bacterium]
MNSYIPYCKGEKIRIVFMFQVASFWPSWDSLYHLCIKDDRFEIKLFWIYEKSGEPSQMETAEPFLKESEIEYEKYDFQKVLQFQPHYAVFQTPYDKGHRSPSAWTARFVYAGIRVVYIPYGIEISNTKESQFKHFSMSVVNNAYLIYVMSKEMKQEYDNYCLNQKAVRALGLPRFDGFKNRNSFFLSGKLSEKINGRKIILWKAHFPKIFIEDGKKKQATPEIEEYLYFAEYAKSRRDLFFIFMPHPKFCDSTIDETLRPLALRLVDKLKKMENVYIDYKDDYRPSLMNSDAIIVDRSAVMVDAGVLDVPVLYMSNQNYYEPMTSPIEALIKTYEQGNTANDMIAFIDRVCKKIDRKREERREAVKKYITCFDGENSQRIKTNLLYEINLQRYTNMPQKIRKNDKVLLFGTGEIYKFVKKMLDRYEKYRPIALLDNDNNKVGDRIDGIPILKPDSIRNMEYDYIVIATDVYYREVRLQLKDLGVKDKNILPYDWFIVLLKYAG